MKLRFHVGAVLAACLAAGLASGSAAHAQRYSSVAQKEGTPPRPAPRQPVRPKLPNALPPRGNPNALPPKAIERLQELPPEKQEQFLRNNERFNSLPLRVVPCLAVRSIILRDMCLASAITV